MRVCLIAVEIFAWGKYGGFGRATRLIGRELVKHGIKVFAVVPRRKGQDRVEILDGITVYGFRPGEIAALPQLFKEIDADIYHSQEPSLSTVLAQKGAAGKKHVITFRDTRDFSDWLVEFSLPSLNPVQVISNWIFEDNFLVHQAVRNADAWFAAANLLIQKAQKKYRLSAPPVFMPTPVEIPAQKPKAKTPTVCYISRWDKRKKPERFLELACHFPDVKFIAVGSSRNASWDAFLRKKYAGLDNLEMPGFINQFESDKLSDILHRSWIMVNTAAREGLPNAFIEAAAHGCAILSAVNPDGFASRFGYHVQDGDFQLGLRHLLNSNTWRSKGEAGRMFVEETFSLGNAIQNHLEAYRQLKDL